jgi:hypothetical protein
LYGTRWTNYRLFNLIQGAGPIEHLCLRVPVRKGNPVELDLLRKNLRHSSTYSSSLGGLKKSLKDEFSCLRPHHSFSFTYALYPSFPGCGSGSNQVTSQSPPSSLLGQCQPFAWPAGHQAQHKGRCDEPAVMVSIPRVIGQSKHSWIYLHTPFLEMDNKVLYHVGAICDSFKITAPVHLFAQ